MLREWARRRLDATLSLGLVVLFLSPASASTVRGTVVDAEEHPVVGASVWLYAGLVESSLSVPEMPRVASGVTGTDGRFSLSCPPEAEGPLALYAYHPGSAIACCLRAEPGRPQWLRLLPAAAIAGQIVDGSGAPLHDAIVGLASASRSALVGPDPGRCRLPRDLCRELAARTDAQGRFELRLTPDGWGAMLWATGAGCGEKLVRWRPDAAPLCRLEPVGSVSGRIRFPAGTAVPAGLPLSAWGFGGDRSQSRQETVADAQGAFSFANLPPGDYSIVCTRQPAGKYHLVEADDIAVAPGAETQVQLEAAETYPVRGRVVTADTGKPVVGASVAVSHVTETQAASVAHGETDTDGRFEVPCMAGDVGIRVTGAPGYAQVVEAGDSFEVADGGLDVGEVALVPTCRVTVRAVDDSGAPVPGAAVLAVGAENLSGRLFGTTDGEGCLTVDDLLPGQMTLRALRGVLASAEVAVDSARTQGTAVLAVAPLRTAGLRARIVDQDGEPFPAVGVSLRRPASGWSFIGLASCPEPAADGTVRMDALLPGLVYHLEVSSEDIDQVDSREWMARAGVVEDLGDLRVTYHDAELHGVVVGPSGRPVAGAKVTVSLDSRDLSRTTTDAEGRFSLSGLVEGWVYAFVEAEGCAYAAGRLQTGPDSRRIALRRAHDTVTGKPLRSPLPPPPADGKATARRLLIETLAAASPDAPGDRRYLLKALAAIDPAAAYEAAAKGRDDVGPLNLAVGKAHLGDDLDEALAQMQQGNEPYEVVHALVEASDAFAPTQQELALACLDSALELAATVEHAAQRVAARAVLGERLWRLGDDRARATLLGAAHEAGELGYAAGGKEALELAAQAVCLVDLDAALALVASIPDSYIDDGEEVPPDEGRQQALELVAVSLATANPDAARKLAEGLRDAEKRQHVVAAVAGAMPPERMEEAVGLARELANATDRAKVLVRLARVAPLDRVKGLLDEAAQGLQADTGGSWLPLPTDALTELPNLSVVARLRGVVDYRQYAWMAASHKGHSVRHPMLPSWQLLPDVKLAAGVVYTDPDLARHVLNAGLPAAGPETVNPLFLPRIVRVLAALDAARTPDLLGHLDRFATSDPSGTTEAVLGVVEVLTSTPEQRERELLRKYEPERPELP